MSGSGNDTFYVGYLEKMPKKYASLMKKFIILLFIGLLVLAFLLVRSQKGFSTSTFELGKSTEIEGVLSFSPSPMVTLADSDESVLLIGYGKFGAEGALLQAMGEDFKHAGLYQVKLKGTLIYHDGKTLMELTSKSKSVLDYKVITADPKKPSSLGQLTLQGEIIDPKCYFGVMKPGEGKPHRSCAIRCISGGIPPMLKVSDELGNSIYFILRGQRGQTINENVLDYVAEPIELKGEAFQYNNWMILNLDEVAGIKPLL